MLSDFTFRHGRDEAPAGVSRNGGSVLPAVVTDKAGASVDYPEPVNTKRKRREHIDATDPQPKPGIIGKLSSAVSSRT